MRGAGKRGSAKPKTPPAPELRIGALARETGVSVATLKHYAREGLITPVRTGRNMAYYGADTVERLRRIKELQRTRYLPLKVIKQLLDGRTKAAPPADLEGPLAGALDSAASPRSRAELIASGVAEDDLAWLEGVGAIRAIEARGEPSYSSDDVELLRTLGAARRAGIDASMLPLEILQAYVEALRALVKVELTLFREGVLPRVQGDVRPLVEAATPLSEKLVVLLRRRLLLPTLRELARGDSADEAAPRARRARRAPAR
ncbi:MAG TPA: MerR family transcriptional regulator [Polyangiaceae bacterium]|nr:MerR family transcriptional regulator [Polyangiaceae bacterium]